MTIEEVNRLKPGDVVVMDDWLYTIEEVHDAYVRARPYLIWYWSFKDMRHPTAQDLVLLDAIPG